MVAVASGLPVRRVHANALAGDRRDAGLARNSAAAATSSGSTQRRSDALSV
jgi:hypothetical protein